MEGKGVGCEIHTQRALRVTRALVAHILETDQHARPLRLRWSATIHNTSDARTVST
jgi:hypothetical protein